MHGIGFVIQNLSVIYGFVIQILILISGYNSEFEGWSFFLKLQRFLLLYRLHSVSHSFSPCRLDCGYHNKKYNFLNLNLLFALLFKITSFK
jgi:hypothetical protein